MSIPPAYRRKKDRNHDAIAQAVTDAGFEWVNMFRVGNGIPDGIAKRGDGFRVWVEVKMPGEGLTDAEHRFFESAPGCKIVATTPEDAIEQLQTLWQMDGAR